MAAVAISFTARKAAMTILFITFILCYLMSWLFKVSQIYLGSVFKEEQTKQEDKKIGDYKKGGCLCGINVMLLLSLSLQYYW